MPSPSARMRPLPAVATMPVQQAAAEQKLSAAWLQSVLGNRLLGRLTAALDWQFWNWGQDVVAIPGNGLIRIGFERCPPPEGIKSSSCYRRIETLPDGTARRFVLRGCGLFFGQATATGLYLPRYRFAPCFHFSESCPALNWSIDRSPVIVAPRSDDELWQMSRLVFQLLQAIGDYEEELQQLSDIEHRKKGTLKWKKQVPLEMDDLAESWRELAAVIRRQFEGHQDFADGMEDHIEVIPAALGKSCLQELVCR